MLLVYRRRGWHLGLSCLLSLVLAGTLCLFNRRIPVREEVIEDDTGMLTSVVIPTPAPVANEEIGSGDEESLSLANN